MLCKETCNTALAILKLSYVPYCLDCMFMNKISKLHMYKYEIQSVLSNTRETALYICCFILLTFICISIPKICKWDNSVAMCCQVQTAGSLWRAEYHLNIQGRSSSRMPFIIRTKRGTVALHMLSALFSSIHGFLW